MKYSSVSELKEGIEYDFKIKMPRDYGNSAIETASHCFDNFYATRADEITQEIVCNLIIGVQLQKYSNRIFIGQYNLVMNAVEKVANSAVMLDLTDSEKNEVIEMASMLKKTLPHMEIEYSPFSK
jgi:hypothetical protein